MVSVLINLSNNPMRRMLLAVFSALCFGATAQITVTSATFPVAGDTLMYVIEGPEHGFTSIPKGIYWAIVTLTTVGFGDIVPKTPLGQAIASLPAAPGPWTNPIHAASIAASRVTTPAAK